MSEKRTHHLTCYFLAGLVSGLFLLAGCGGSRGSELGLSRAEPQDSKAEAAPLIGPNDAPSTEQLKQLLQQEFVRLGIDPDRVVASAPEGDENAVFDLSAAFYDRKKGIVLNWTERLVGDYDMNGEVYLPDITPIASYWRRAPEYRDSAEAAGLSWWPQGSPLDAGFSAVFGGPPALNSGAQNWRIARVDGDSNGEVYLPDITPIAMHWKQKLDSYRVYRKAPGETEFTLQNPEGEKGASLLRSSAFRQGENSPNPDYNVVLRYIDLSRDAGEYSYYVAAWDSESETEGPPSNIASITFEAGHETPLPDPQVNAAPVAVMQTSVTEGEAPLTVQFDASDSYDPDGLIALYVWDWDGDGQSDESSYNSPLASHVYTEGAFYHPALTVYDATGSSATSTTEIEVTVRLAGLYPPKLQLTANPASGGRPLNTILETEITDPDSALFHYSWDFDADGSEDLGMFSSANYAHPYSYETAGQHSTRLTITDEAGMSSMAMVTLDVAANADPLAALSADVTSGEEQLAVAFDAGASTDPDGDVLSYDWDFEGDGTFDFSSGPVPTTNHLYNTVGEYLATVKVTDEHGASALATQAISVTAHVNIPPVAVLTADRYSAPVPATILLISQDSYDPDGQIVNYRYDFDGDQVFDFENPLPGVSHVFADLGDFTVTLEVVDDAGASTQAQITISTFINHAPVAALNADPLSGSAPLLVNFDASASSDEDGDEITYAWSLNYDMLPNAWVSGTETNSTTYETLGSRKARVRVIDSWGAQSEAEVAVSVSGTGWYVVQVDTGSPSGYSPDIGLQVVNGMPGICYVGHGDGIGPGNNPCFARALDAKGLSWNLPLELQQPETGALAPALGIVNGGPVASWFEDSGQVYFSRGQDFSGFSWSLPKMVYWISGTADSTAVTEVNGRPAMCWVDALGWLRYSRSDDSNGAVWSSVQNIEKLANYNFNQQAEMVMVVGKPSIAAVHEADDTIKYYRSSNPEGSAWDPPVVVATVTNAGPGVALDLVNSNPMIAYYCDDGLVCQIAPDGVGATWNAPVVIDGSQIGNGGIFVSGPELCITELNGRPAVLDRGMRLWEANDFTGQSWKPYDSIPGFSGSTFALREVDGLPAIAFQTQGGKVFYAIRLD